MIGFLNHKDTSAKEPNTQDQADNRIDGAMKFSQYESCRSS